MKTSWLYGLTGLASLALCSYAVWKEELYLMGIPIFLLLVWLATRYPKEVFLFLAFATPLSVNLENTGIIGDFGLFVPTEPLYAGLMILYLALAFRQEVTPKGTLFHPLSLIVLAQVAWMLITVFTSELPAVSVKAFIAKVWFVVPVFYLGVNIFSKEKNIKLFIQLFIYGTAVVCIYTLIHHSLYQFTEQAGHWVMSPFFKDHTSYGAILAMVFPPLLVFYHYAKGHLTTRMFYLGLIVLITIALVFSYTRAAWLSLVGVFAIYLVIKFKIKFQYLAFFAVAGLVMVGLSWNSIIMQLERNDTDSSDDFAEHIESMSNISTDASNLERINRWTAAYNMFKERPVFGFGPGTYAMVYAPYQDSRNLTVISTNFGDLGSAHSEYLGPLSEQGLMGMLLVLVFVGLMVYYGLTTFQRMEPGFWKSMVLALTLSLITYFVHGVLNSYLDTDKASVPVFGFLAIILSINLRLNAQKNGNHGAGLVE